MLFLLYRTLNHNVESPAPESESCKKRIVRHLLVSWIFFLTSTNLRTCYGKMSLSTGQFRCYLTFSLLLLLASLGFVTTWDQIYNRSDCKSVRFWMTYCMHVKPRVDRISKMFLTCVFGGFFSFIGFFLFAGGGVQR
jgi:hypothetical protein